MAANIQDILSQQKDLIETLIYKCSRVDQTLAILTPVDKLLGELEELLKKCKAKHNVLLSYAANEGVKEYINDKSLQNAEESVEKVRQKIFDLQSANIAKISSIKTNFTKDSTERKTRAYLEKRLAALEEAWNKVVDFNDALKQIPNKSDRYFTQDVFKQSKTQFSELKETITKMLEKTEPEKATSEPILATMTSSATTSGSATATTSATTSAATSDSTSAQVDRITIQTIKMEKLKRLAETIQHEIDSTGKSMTLKFQEDMAQKWKEIENLDDQIRANKQRFENLDSYMERYDEINAIYRKASICMSTKLDELNKENTMDHKLRIKPIELSKFTGNSKDWTTFFETFKDAAERAGLSKIAKLHYLLDNLEAEPKKTVNHLQINAENYENAVKLLKERYQNQRKTETAFIENILHMEPLQPRSAQSVVKMHDAINESIVNLKNFGYSIEHCSRILTVIILEKFDYDTSRIFEESLEDPRQIPELTYILEFLSRRYKALDSMKTNKRVGQSGAANKREKSHAHLTTKGKCPKCNGAHTLSECQSFSKLNVKEKQSFVRTNKICKRCLEHEYVVSDPKCDRKCTECNKPHHSLLHNPDHKPKAKNKQEPKQSTTHHSSSSAQRHQEITCLPTAQIHILDQLGDVHTMRALIDQGSQSTFITERAAQLLKLPKHRVNIQILGVGNIKAASIKHVINVQVQPRVGSTKTHLMEAKVISTLTGTHPETRLENPRDQFRNFTMADPDFDKPGNIDIIIGADYLADIILTGVEKIASCLLQETTLGWIVSGKMLTKGNEIRNKIHTLVSRTEIEKLNEQLKRFWDTEEFRETPKNSEAIEQSYAEQVKRGTDGRYTVHLPMIPNGELGSSREQALARFRQVENKLQKDPKLHKLYKDFMHEYRDLGHMTFAKPKDNAYFLPHHAVLKPDSETTKLRVVFDASATTTNGNSLNDVMHVGPNLLQDLMAILMRWRLHKVVFTADIEKMFRQIRVDESQRDFQRILWRSDPKNEIMEYRLNTVTYGTAAASFLAIRTLHQLANDESNKHPIAAELLKRDFYMDDCLSGCQNETEALEIVKDLKNLLAKGCMNLRKWRSNKPEILNGMAESDKSASLVEFNKDAYTSKTLGIHWDPINDHFSFKVNYERPSKITKRHVVSTVAKIFDPLGWLQPAILIGKHMMQKLSADTLAWDEEIPLELQEEWLKYATNLHTISQIRIPRWTGYQGKTIEIFGFCDASETAYAAVIYSVARNEQGHPQTSLVAAKSKVAPLREKLTIPKLELKGALLLAELMNKCLKSLQVESVVRLFCDSKAALGWITGTRTRNDIFVTNRVNQIRELTDKTQWFYVNTKDNPADCASRGLTPTKIESFSLWWKGPSWITEPLDSWEKYGVKQETSTHTTQALTTAQVEQPKAEEFWHALLRKYSSFNKTIKVIALLKRFKENCKREPAKRLHGSITLAEWEESHNLAIKALQQEIYPEEVQALKNGKPLSKKSHILKLTPFIDDFGVIRVRSRAEEGATTDDFKYPVILPKHSLTQALIYDSHLKHLHGGPQLVRNNLRSKYWIIGGKTVVNATIKTCMKCHRFKAQPQNQLMGNLPKARILPAPPFASSGVDYAGPFVTKLSTARTTKTIKSYIAVFVCMVTKAVHLELVTGLTSEAFLAAFRRFTSRRGHCKDVYSDNGTNFVGAQKIIAQDYERAIQNATREAAEALIDDGTTWHFIPPRSPHFGGLWEAAVKSLKKHLQIELADKLLSYEEFSTLLCRIEACLNSRPLSQLSSDPNDMEALTPGHFLIGRALTGPPEASTDITTHKRWEMLKRMQENFWNRWQKDYLSNLVIRGKWNTQKPNLKVGELIMIKDKAQSPLKWPLARVVELYEGPDGLVRVVDIRMGKDVIKRASLENICKLPIECEPEIVTKPAKIEKMSHTILQPKESTDRRRTPPRIWLRRPASDDVRALVDNMENPNEGTSASAGQPKRQKISSWRKVGLCTTILLSLCMAQTPQVKADQNITVFYPQAGIYVEELGEVIINRGQVRIDVKMEIEDIRADKAYASKTIEKYNVLCRQAVKETKDHHCERWLAGFTKRLAHITSSINVILDQAKSRQKRGWLGQVLTTVFGVNDDVYRSIDDLEESQSKLNEKTAKQANLLLSAIQKINSHTQRQVSMISDKINQGVELINELQNQSVLWNNILERQKINYHMIAITLDIESLLDEISSKFDSLAKALHGDGALMDFIKFYDLKETIERIVKHLPNNVEVENKPDGKLLTSITSEEIIIHGYLNLKDTSKFKLLAATAIPKKTGENSFAATITSTLLVAIDFNSQRYFNTTIAEIEKCSPRGNSLHFCTVTSTHDLERNNCINEQLLNRQNSWSCQLKHFKVTQPLWVQLMKENTWLTVVNEATRIATICSGRREELTITDTAIVKVNNGCIIKTKDINILSSQRSTLRVKGTYHRTIHTPLDSNETNGKLSRSNTTRTMHPIIKLEQPLVSDTLSTMENLELRTHHFEHHAISITTSVIIILAIIAGWAARKNIWSCVVKCCQRVQRKTRAGQPNMELTTIDGQQQGSHESTRVWTTTLDPPREYVRTEQI